MAVAPAVAAAMLLTLCIGPATWLQAATTPLQTGSLVSMSYHSYRYYTVITAGLGLCGWGQSRR